MIKTMIIGVAGMVILMILWLVIQSAWRDLFIDEMTDEDVLATRSGCGNCGCTTLCKNGNTRTIMNS